QEAADGGAGQRLPAGGARAGAGRRPPRALTAPSRLAAGTPVFSRLTGPATLAAGTPVFSRLTGPATRRRLRRDPDRVRARMASPTPPGGMRGPASPAALWPGSLSPGGRR